LAIKYQGDPNVPKMMMIVAICECGAKEVVAEDMAYVDAWLESSRSDAQMNAVFEFHHYTTGTIYSAKPV
jgi:hypothetical protein